MTMADATAEFFEGLGDRGHEPLLGKISGSVLFELANGRQTDRWLVSIDKGDLSVSRKGGRADAVVRARKDVFDGIAGGEVNAMAAVLRGAVAVDGNLALVARLQRLFPGPPKSARRAARAGRGASKR
jgi:putative sterol carrier protein